MQKGRKRAERKRKDIEREVRSQTEKEAEGTHEAKKERIKNNETSNSSGE